MRTSLSFLLMAGVGACSGDETATGSSTTSSQAATTNGATSTAMASGTGGSGQGGASVGGGGAGQGGSMQGTFACGPTLQCQQGSEYCDVFQPGIPCSMPVYSCTPLPNNCQPDPSCECFPPHGPDCMCSESPQGDITITCMGI